LLKKLLVGWLGIIRDPADIGKASGTFGVFGSALAVSGFDLSHYLFDYQRPALVCQDIFFDISFGVLKTVADEIIHGVTPHWDINL
jgi:hypothetical protein